MNISIPLYIEQTPSTSEAASVYKVNALFFSSQEVSDEKLQRAFNKFVKNIHVTLEQAGKQFFQEEIATFGFSPDVKDYFLRIPIEFKKRTITLQMLFVTFKSLDRRLAFTPSIPSFWFELPRGKKLEDQAKESLTQHFQHLERKEGLEISEIEEMSVKGRAWINTIEVDFQIPRPKETKAEENLATLGSFEQLDGRAELEKVGRCLNWLYPDELGRAIYREEELKELTKLLKSGERRPILLIGQRMAGKTTIIHEYVYRDLESRKHAMYKPKHSVWLLSPQRLISGMSYVGQWENRLLAILKTAKKNQMILYFDDLIGLFSAGITNQSQLSVADVIKPMLEKHEFQMIGEITPAAFRVLQERERSFADLFHLIPVKETTADQSLSILISSKRQLEHNHNCWFEPEILPTAINIQHRYIKDAVFPGKAAAFLSQVAVKYRNTKISRNDLLSEFQAKSGLSLAFLDDNTKLSRKEIVEALSKDIIGQSNALEAAADVISIAKSKLNDPERPLATFLFLGPTGVGKTQCAKALAKYLFGSAERLLRFDMNEFITPDSLVRLVGTFQQPEGLLTSAVRRQPFSILLLDEIEKADPDVFNLLLQVMGEGRLTDASGRTVDFTNVFIIMTSNLGVKEANTKLGFQESENNETAVYLQAVEKFFRPEFFNRIDRVIPFKKLSREDMGKIATLLIQSIFSREGLIRRKCLLNIDAQAMEKIIQEGYNPTFGARALKRVIERQITQPVANQLVALSNDLPTIINIYSTKDGIGVYLEALTEVCANDNIIIKADLLDTKAIFKQIEDRLSKIEIEVDKLSPKGAIDPSNLDPATYQYFQIKDQMRRVNAICRNIKQRFDITGKTSTAKQPIRANRQPSGYKKEVSIRRAIDRQGFWKQLFAAEDIHFALQEISNNAVLTTQEIKDQIVEALREFTLLELMINTDFSLRQQVVIYIHPIVNKNFGHQSPQERLAESYLHLFNSKVGLESAMVTTELPFNDQVILVSGSHALELVQLEVGTHLFFLANGQLYPVLVRVFPLDDGEKASLPILKHINEGKQWLNLFLDGQAKESANPAAMLPVIRVYEEKECILDLKTGLVADLDGDIPKTEMHMFLLSALPWTFTN